MSEEMKIITLGDIFENIETEEKAFKFKDYIKDLQQKVEQLEKENKRLKRIENHYQKYRNSNEIQQEIYDILELGKHHKNLHQHKNTGGLNWIDLPMTKFSSISSYIRARDLELEDYKLNKGSEE